MARLAAGPFADSLPGSSSSSDVAQNQDQGHVTESKTNITQLPLKITNSESSADNEQNKEKILKSGSNDKVFVSKNIAQSNVDFDAKPIKLSKEFSMDIEESSLAPDHDIELMEVIFF